MNRLESTGYKRTVLISIMILIISSYTIFYDNFILENDIEKLTRDLTRLLFTVILLYLTYQGRNWARILFVILFSIGLVGALYSLFWRNVATKIPFAIMIVAYPFALYHFTYAKSYRAFVLHQKSKKLINKTNSGGLT